jgi:hypothetical protein
VAAGIVIIVAHFVKKMKDTKGAAEVRAGAKLPTKSKGGRGNVDSEFFKRIKRLIEIVVPSWTSPEAKILL